MPVHEKSLDERKFNMGVTSCVGQTEHDDKGLQCGRCCSIVL